jgi:hypothetical protein
MAAANDFAAVAGGQTEEDEEAGECSAQHRQSH